MRKVEKLKLKNKYIVLLKIFGFIVCLFLGLFIFYEKEIHDLTKLGYSEIASKNILFSLKKDYVESIGENKTLNAAFESEYIKEEYLDNYSRIKYVEHKNIIKNINSLIKVGYSNHDINIIMSHGSDEAVSEFAKRDKVKYLEEFFSIDYAKIDLYDRYVKYSDETGEDEEYVVLIVNLDLDKNDYEDAFVIDKFSVDMLINKHRCLTDNYEPDDLVVIGDEYTNEKDLYSSRIALNAFIEMYNDAAKEDLHLIINSAYRSYQDQVDLSNLYLRDYGQAYVDKYVAKPGFSEHQTGLSFDIGSTTSRIFADSKEYDWMKDNAYKYGFILRFPKKYETITGFRNEPWHYRYVGKEIAKYIYEHNITLEEYFVMFLNNE